VVSIRVTVNVSSGTDLSNVHVTCAGATTSEAPSAGSLDTSALCADDVPAGRANAATVIAPSASMIQARRRREVRSMGCRERQRSHVPSNYTV
jgi:hypothetical protein